MIRSYCGECGQEMTACECPKDERIPLLNMTQKDFDRSITEAYRRGLDVMGERASALCDMRSVDHWLSVLSARDTYTRDTADAMSSEAEQCAEAIRALEVKP